jgi:Leucine-rich repeat (LRR) protein
VIRLKLSAMAISLEMRALPPNDVLLVWKRLAREIRSDDFKGEFGDWFRKNAGVLARVDAVDLSYLEVSSIPVEIGQLTHLTALSLANNPLGEAPACIFQLTLLKILHLCGTGLRVVSPEIGNLSRLESLDLGTAIFHDGNSHHAIPNHLTQLPPEIGRLVSLAFLRLRGNQLRELPPEIERLTNLKKFDVSVNQLSTLPPGFSCLKKLSSLNLTKNRFSTVPSLSGLQRLDTLYLAENHITELPPEINRLSNLIHIYLQDNQLTFLPRMDGFSKLFFLNLDGNKLTTIDSSLANLPAQAFVYTQHNLLTPAVNKAFRALIEQRRLEDSRRGPQFVSDSVKVPVDPS